MEGTFWAIVPTLLTIVIALITREVYVALFIGVFAGAMLLSSGNPINALTCLFDTMSEKMSGDNGFILIFILMLGVMVVLMSRSGGTKAFSSWAGKHVKSDKSAHFMLMGVSVCMFMDDYFNRMAVSSVMRPVSDSFNVSRAKLAYLIGGMSVCVCMLIPLSSWASAIVSNISKGAGDSDAFGLYLQSIGMNFYPILMLVVFVVTGFFGDVLGIKKKEDYAHRTGDIYCGTEPRIRERTDEVISEKGKTFDVLLPIIVLVAVTLIFKSITGRSELALVIGSVIAVIFCAFLYIPRKLMTLKEYTSSFAAGFTSIGEVAIILVLAWTLTGICVKLDVNTFIASITANMGGAKNLLPAIIFVLSMGTAFATGTAWGTFGILVPLVLPMFGAGSSMQILCIGAVLSGSVFGNQVSPISDVTVLTSAITNFDHMEYIKSQLTISFVVAGAALLGFLLSGLTQMIWLGWIVSLSALAVFFIIVYTSDKKKLAKNKAKMGEEPVAENNRD